MAAGFSLSLGLIMLVAFWIGDKPGDGLVALGIMAAVGARPCRASAGPGATSAGR